MLTPWGDLPVADGHVHFFSHGFFSLLGSQKQCSLSEVQSILGWEMPAEDPVEFAARWLAELDRHGVERATLIASLPPDFASAAAAARAFPDRFVGAAMIDPRKAPAVLPAELRMLCLFPALHGYALTDPAVAAFVEAHQDRVIFVHCGVLSIGVRQKLGLEPSRFDLRLSNPLDLHALVLRFPHTQFVIPHFGAGFWREALMVAEQSAGNVWLDTSSSNSWMKLQPGDVELATVFRRTLAVTDRLVFGTDSSFFPRGWHRAILDVQLAALEKINAAETTVRDILHGNFQRLFP